MVAVEQLRELKKSPELGRASAAIAVLPKIRTGCRGETPSLELRPHTPDVLSSMRNDIKSRKIKSRKGGFKNRLRLVESSLEEGKAGTTDEAQSERSPKPCLFINR
jgi:hypothetical protein